MGLNIVGEIVENSYTVKLEGSLDSNSASDAEKKISELCDPYSDKAMVIDAENLEYISSAGLRVLLKLKKEHKDFQWKAVK